MSVGIAVAVVVLTGWSFFIGSATYDSRAERLAARTPVLAGLAGPQSAFARWSDLADTHSERQFAVVFVSPLDGDAPPPPGLPRWPERGEVFLSPGLLASGDGIAERYGRLAGTIGGEGLADSGEWLAYARPVSDAGFDRVDGRPTFVTGWGVDPATYSGGEAPAWFTASHGYTRPLHHLYWLLTAAAAVPAVSMVLVVARWREPRLSRALTHLRAQRLSGGGPALVRAGAATVPAALGAVAGVSAATVSTMVDVKLPVTGYRLTAADLAANQRWLPVLGLAAIVAVVTVAALVPWRHAPGGNRRVFRPAHARPMLAVCAAVVGAGTLSGGTGGVTAYVVGTLIGLVVLCLLAEPIGAAAETRFRRIADTKAVVPRSGRTVPRRSAAPTAVRVALAVTIAVYAGVLATASFIPHGRTRAENLAYGQHGAADLTEVRARWNDRELAAFTAAIPDATVLYVTRAGDSTVLVGDCGGLAVLGVLAGCPRTAMPADMVYTARNAAGTAFFEHSFVVAPGTLIRARSAPVPAQRLTGLLVLGPHRVGGTAAIKRAAYATLTMPLVARPGESWVVGSSSSLGLRRWIYLFGLWSVTLVLLAGAMALWQRQGTGGSTARARRPMTTAVTRILLPLGSAAIGGISGAALLSAGVLLLAGG